MKKKGKPVIHPKIIDLDTGKIFDTFTEAGESVNGNRGGVRKCCDNMQEHHKGHHFKYLLENRG